MADFDDLKNEVDALDPLLSNEAEIRLAYQHIEDAFKVATNGNLNELSEILTTFRDDKLPPDLEFNKIRASAKDLDEAIKLGNIAAAIARVKSRNTAISNLASALDVESKKAKKDASLLARITAAVDKADKTVVAVKALVDQLQESDKSTKDKLKALIDAVNTVSSIFQPQNS